MRFHKRVLSLELKNRSLVGLGNLSAFDLTQFSFLVNKTDNLQNLDGLSLSELDLLNYHLRIAQPNSKSDPFKIDEMNESQLEEILDRLESLKAKESPFDWKIEVEKELMRRALRN